MHARACAITRNARSSSREGCAQPSNASKHALPCVTKRVQRRARKRARARGSAKWCIDTHNVARAAGAPVRGEGACACSWVRGSGRVRGAGAWCGRLGRWRELALEVLDRHVARRLVDVDPPARVRCTQKVRARSSVKRTWKVRAKSARERFARKVRAARARRSQSEGSDVGQRGTELTRRGEPAPHAPGAPNIKLSHMLCPKACLELGTARNAATNVREPCYVLRRKAPIIDGSRRTAGAAAHASADQRLSKRRQAGIGLRCHKQ
eukprot:3912610-Pleurochrysis_carterae.AAC.1